ncbi:MAG: hypothetical protein V2J11_09715 [Desulfofustis sp.]|jgi:hypothetical protein|nr:hypothetical protein [Desulfofustis sp.]
MTRLQSSLLRAAVLLCVLGLTSCASRNPDELAHTLPATDAARITFEKQRVPDNCTVFAHLLITVPPTLAADQTRQSIEQFAAGHGADFVLLGLSRQSTLSPETEMFRAYGPQTPYPFATRWAGWKFGFSDWNKGGPLVDFGVNHLNGREATFTTPVDIQAVLLSCPAGPANN